MAERRPKSRGFIWAWIGGAVLAAAATAVVAITLTSPRDSPDPSASTSASPGASPAAPNPSTPVGDDVVDGSVVDAGWVPEPITTDPEVYLRAAIEAAGTADTTRASRDEWLTYLDSWFTLDPRFTDPAEQDAQTGRYQQEMREVVVFPEQLWESMASKDARVTAATVGELTFTPVPDYDGDDMIIGTSDVTLTFTEASEDGSEHSYDEQVRVSAQVLCGAASVPTPGTAQAAGDCKLIRYFDTALGS